MTRPIFCPTSTNPELEIDIDSMRPGTRIDAINSISDLELITEVCPHLFARYLKRCNFQQLWEAVDTVACEPEINTRVVWMDQGPVSPHNLEFYITGKTRVPGSPVQYTVTAFVNGMNHSTYYVNTDEALGYWEESND